MDEATRKVEHAKVPGPERIWLSPSCDPERSWCQDAVYEVCDCGAVPVAYLRADLAAPKTVAATSADPAADLALVKRLRQSLHMTCHDAAAAIERLLRERDAAQVHIVRLRHAKGIEIRRAEKAEAERDAALRERDEAIETMTALDRYDSMRRLNKESGSV